MQQEKVELDELDLQVERRKEIYKHELFVKVGPFPIRSHTVVADAGSISDPIQSPSSCRIRPHVR